MTNLKVESNHKVGIMRTYLRYFLRYLFFYLQFVTLPLALVNVLNLALVNNILSHETITYIALGLLVIFGIYYLINLLLVATRKSLFYENLSETHLVNTTKKAKLSKSTAKITQNNDSKVSKNDDQDDEAEENLKPTLIIWSICGKIIFVSLSR